MYGKAIEKYPVEYGDTWTVGPHVFGCFDTCTEEAADVYDAVDYIYCDPPWDSAIMTAFRRLNSKSRSPCPTSPLVLDVWESIGQLAERLQVRRALIDMGLKYTPEFIHTMKRHGFGLREYSEVYYGSPPHPESFMVYDRDHTGKYKVITIPGTLPDRKDYLTGIALTERNVAHYCEPDTVLADPCIGTGFALSAAIKNHMICVGTEFTAEKLAVCIDRAAKMTGETPEKRRN